MVVKLTTLILVAALFSAFSWMTEGGADKEEREGVSVAEPLSPERRGDEPASVPRTSSRQETPQEESGTAEVDQLPVQLISHLASGDEETRRARLESIRRLSEALSRLNVQPED